MRVDNLAGYVVNAATCLAVVVAVACLSIDESRARAECTFDPAVQRFRSIELMPAPLSEFLLSKFGGPAPDIAPRGGEFNISDVIYGASPPQRRVVEAGRAGDRWFLWYEHGGYAYHQHLVLLEFHLGDRAAKAVTNISDLRGDFCAPVKQWLSGKPLPEPTAKQSEW
jgi:hypothetical protein